MNKKYILFFGIMFQLIFFISWISYNEYLKNDKNSKEIWVKTIPVDPRDLLSGNYFILEYDFTRCGRHNTEMKKYQEFCPIDSKNGDELYIILKLIEDKKFFVKDRIVLKKPLHLEDNEIFIKARRQSYNKLSAGIERFYINENVKEPKNSKIFEIQLKINKNGVARIINSNIIKDKNK